MAKSDLWQKLNAEVSIASVKALLTGQPARPPSDAAGQQAEEILEYAAREAKLRGKPVESVLSELGFSMGAGPSAASASAAPAPTPAPATWSATRTPTPAPAVAPAPAASPASATSASATSASATSTAPSAVSAASTPTPLLAPSAASSAAIEDRIRGEALRAVALHLAPLTEADVRLLLEAEPAASGLLARLGCLYPDLKGPAQAAAAAPVPWLALFMSGVAAAVLADAVRAAPGCPPLLSSGADFRDFAVQRGLVAPEQRLDWLRALTPAALCQATADFTGLPALPTIGRKPPSKAALAGFPLEWIRPLRLVPLRRSGAALVVAAPYAPPERLLQQLEARLGRKVQLHLAPQDEVLAAIASWFELPAEAAAPAVTPAPAAVAPAAAVAQIQPPVVQIQPPVAQIQPPVAQIQPIQPPAQVRPVAPAPVAPAPAAAPSPARPVVSPGRDHGRALLPELRYNSAVDLVQRVLQLALEARATDIHIEPAERGARIRFRIDGICHEVSRLEPEPYAEVVARLKILADLDVTERRRPQDGHIHTDIGGTDHDLRVATVPARGGEKIGIRIANTGRVRMRLDQLGLDAHELAVLRDVASLPFGMILATGPVGSGKTTTLYSCLNEVDRTQRHVMSIEDPIEFTLEGANHVEVNYALGFDFVSGLRALLRQDPDTILIGEIRDEETARIAVRGSMTGLMVYSTLHANDATGAVTTLRNFHIPSHLLSSAIRGVVAQRLLRKICEQCKVPQPIGAAELLTLNLTELPTGFAAFRGQGCPACLHTGYSGRTGVFEIFRVDERVRDLILEDRSEREIRAYAVSQGMRTLQQDGVRKIEAGVTTIEEYHRVLRF